MVGGSPDLDVKLLTDPRRVRAVMVSGQWMKPPTDYLGARTRRGDSVIDEPREEVH